MAIFGPSGAQSHPVPVLSVDSGLRSGYVYCALRDASGYTWIGTQEGLQRFDGERLQFFPPDPSKPGSIKALRIMRMAEDKAGRIWMVGESGLEYYSPVTGRFTAIPSTYQGTGEARTMLRIVDSIDLGFVHGAVSADFGMFFSLSRGTFMERPEDFTPAQLAYASQLHYLSAFDNESFSRQPVTRDQHIVRDDYVRQNPFQLLEAVATPGAIWYTSVRPGGIYRLDHERRQPVWIPLRGMPIAADKWKTLTFFDLNDSLAMGGLTEFGLIMFDKRTGEILRTWDFRHHPSLSRAGRLTCLFQDPQGFVWFSAMSFGIWRIHPLGHRFQTFRNTDRFTLLENTMPRGLVADDKSNIWIGYMDGHIQVFDPSFEHVLGEIAGPDHGLRSVGALRVVHPYVYIDHGAYRLASGGEGISFKRTPRADPGISSTETQRDAPRMYRINVYDSDSLIVTGVSGYRQIPRPLWLTGSPEQYDLGGRRSLFALTDKVILAAESGDSLALLRTYRTGVATRGCFQYPDSDTVWLATSGGIGMIDLARDSFTLFRPAGWPASYLYSVLGDDRGRLWFGSNFGLVRFEPATGHSKIFDYRNGLQSNEFNGGCAARLGDGSFAFAGPNGVTIFHPDYFDLFREPFSVYLRGVLVNGQEIMTETGIPDVLTLHPGDESLEIRFGARKYYQRDALRFFVRLEGADAEWVNVGRTDVMRYTGLQPGSYRFHLKAIDADGYESGLAMALPIIVRPAFHQTTWFILLIAMILIAIAGIIFKQRLDNMRRTANIRNRISRDLHDDIGSTLGSISLYSEVAKRMSGPAQTDVLDKIGDNAREMTERLNDIVWSIHPDHDLLAHLADRMRNHAALVLTPAGISFDFRADDDLGQVKIPMEARRHVFLLFKEALHNIVKYARCTHVGIRVGMHGSKPWLDIADNGQGFDETADGAYNGNGLKSMRERAEALGGKLVIDSVTGRGTRIQIRYTRTAEP